MRVGLDLDGVCYSFDRALAHHMIVNRGFSLERCTPSRSWEFYEEWGMDLNEFLEAFAEGVDVGIIFAQGDAYPGTREAVQKILDAGNDIHIITDRTIGSPGVAEGATAKWVASNLPRPIKSLTFSRDKTVLPTDIMIDDKPSNWEALDRVGCDAWLLDRPWNQEATHITKRVQSLDEFADIVINHRRVYVTL